MASKGRVEERLEHGRCIMRRGLMAAVGIVAGLMATAGLARLSGPGGSEVAETAAAARAGGVEAGRLAERGAAWQKVLEPPVCVLRR